MRTAALQASPAVIQAERRKAGAELGRWRKAARWSQTDLARKTGYGRATVGAAERDGAGSQDLWRDMDEALGAGGELARRRDEVAAMAAVAAEEAVRQGLRPPGGRPPAGTVSGGGDDPLIAVRECPGCGTPLFLRVALLPVMLPSPRRAAAIALIPGPPVPRCGGAGRPRPGPPRDALPAPAGGRRAGCRILPPAPGPAAGACGQRPAATPEFWASTSAAAGVPCGPM